jgi:hypothetical protein
MSIKMAIRKAKLGGTDFVDGEVLYDYDLDDTQDAILNMAGIGIAQNAYQILQANNVFDNKDFLATDEFTDETGTNNTVEVDNTSSIYYSGKYISIAKIQGTGTLFNPNSFLTPTNAWDDDRTTNAVLDVFIDGDATYYFGETFPSKYINYVEYKISTEQRDDRNNFAAYLETYNGTIWTTIATLGGTTGDSIENIHSGSYYVNDTIQGIRIRFFHDSVGYTDDIIAKVYVLNYASEYGISTLEVSQNTLTLDGTEKSICVYGDVTNTVNTNVTVDISDGVTTLSAQTLNEVIGLNGFTSGTLKLTFNLTGNSTDTPIFFGYGVYLK